MIKMTIKVVIGVFVGILLLYLFILFGGADYLKAFGRKTEQAGEELKQYLRFRFTSTNLLRKFVNAQPLSVSNGRALVSSG